MDIRLLRKHLEELTLSSAFSGPNDLREIAKLAGIPFVAAAKYILM